MHRVLPGGLPEDLEALLAAAYAVEMPAELGVLVDRRVRRALRNWRPQTSTGWRLGRLRRWRLALIPVLVAVLTASVLVATSASGGPAAVYNSYGGYAWEHAEKLGLVKTVDGYRITLERAYADANQMMLAVTVVDTQHRGWRQVDVGGLSVADSSGGEWAMTTGISDPVNVSSAATIRWFEAPEGPAVSGPRPFTVTVSSIRVLDAENGSSANDPKVDPWRAVGVNASFTFELTVVGGSQAKPQVSSGGTGVTNLTPGTNDATNLSATSNGVTITLESIITSPSSVRLDLRLTGSPPDGMYWSPIVLVVNHNGRDLDVAMQTSQLVGSLTTVYTSAGVEDSTGDWTVPITQLMGDGTDASNLGHDVRYDGNWTLHFSLP
jgi:hypothetical protein